MPKAQDLTGRIVGDYKVIHRAPMRGIKSYWVCECQHCGKQKEVQACYIISGMKGVCCSKTSSSADHLNNIQEERICLICQNSFIANNHKRLYCYECSPSKMSSADAIRYRKRRIKHLLVLSKGGKCERCGYNACEGALQFHHRDPSQKEFALSDFNLNNADFSMAKVYAELDKCDMLCANCHAEIHYLES